MSNKENPWWFVLSLCMYLLKLIGKEENFGLTVGMCLGQSLTNIKGSLYQLACLNIIQAKKEHFGP